MTKDGTTPTVIDVTLRDGGYVNQHSWTLTDAIRITEAVAAAGVPAAEVGYYRPLRQGQDGQIAPSASCPDYYLEQLRAATPDAFSLVVMAHQKDVRPEDYRRLATLGVDMVRLPTKITALGGVRAHVDAIHAAGLRAGVNLIRVSELSPREISEGAAAADAAQADVIYLADSNGSLFPEDLAGLFRLVRNETDRELGFHAHDGLSLAFGNSLAALEAGCTHLDASLGGMGKGGGNLSLELISGYLSTRREAGIEIAPLAHATQEVLAPWRGGALGRCESIVSSLLNLNLDDIAGLRTQTGRGLLHLLDRQPASAIPAA